MFFSRRTVYFSSFLKASTFLAALNLSSQPLEAGKWAEYILNGEIEKATAIACEKIKKYEDLSKYAGTIHYKKYALAYFPELDGHKFSQGLYTLIDGKMQKWQTRYNDSYNVESQQQEAGASLSYKAILREGPKNNDEWKFLLDTFYYNYSLFSQAQVNQTVLKPLKFMLDNSHRSSEDIKKVGESIKIFNTTGPVILHAINKSIESSIEKLQKFHSLLTQHLENLMGIDREALKQHFNSPSVAVVIDVEFNEVLSTIQNRPLNPALSQQRNEYRHGDTMEYLIKFISPQTKTLNYYYHGTPAPLMQYEHFSRLNHPIVFNCSFGFHCNWSFLEKTDKGIKFFNEQKIQRDDKEHVRLLKANLRKAFPDKNCDGVLDEEQIKFLETCPLLSDPYLEGLSFEEMARKAFPEKDQTKALDEEQLKCKEELENWQFDCAKQLKLLVSGHDSNQTHLLCASARNVSGALTKTEYHSGRMELLEEEETQKHALIALNFDFSENALVQNSHSAGDYKDMAVVIPAAYIFLYNGKDGNMSPLLRKGGHSSATAILSGIISCVRGYYPTLDHLEVRRAILEGANRTFAGYDPELHGQGMVNLKGALEISKKILASKTSSTASTTSVSSTSHMIEDKEAIISQLTAVYNYHVGKGVKQLATLAEDKKHQVLEKAVFLVLDGTYATPDTAPLMRAWESVVKDPLSHQLAYVYSYHIGNGVKQLTTLSETQKKQVLEEATSLVLNGTFSIPDTAPLMRAWEMVTGRDWNQG